MMLHSGARCLTWISRRLSQALIVTAGLSVAGCGGRFFETPTALSRSVSAPTSEETAGRATLEDASSESSTGVRAGARRLLATLFGRNPESSEPLRDPFLDTPVFAHVETSEAPVGVAHTADGERATASVAPSRRIVRPPRRSDPTPQPEIEEAAARLAAAATRTEPRDVRDHELPEWAIPSHQNRTNPPLTHEPDQTSPWAQEQTRVAVSEGRVRIGRLQSQPRRTETAPEPSRKIESLLAARNAAATRREPPAAAQPQARAPGSVAKEWPGAPAVAQRATGFTPPAAAAAQHNTGLPPWAVAAREQPSPDTIREVRDTVREVRDLPTHFDNVLALAQSPAPEPVRRPGTGVATASAGMNPTRWEPAAISRAANISHEDDDPDRPESATESPFPVLNEWRGVGANTPVTVADAGDRDVRAEFGIHQTAFEEDSEEEGLRSAGFDVPGRPEAATIAPAPPGEANPGIRFSGAAAGEQEESGSLSWFIALLIAIGLGIVVYRFQLRRGES